MNRREILRQLGFGMAGMYALPSVLSSCSKEDPGPEVNYSGNVAIIGAGAAGLCAADILHSKGIKVTIYEASEQIGGRVRSIRNQITSEYPNIPLLSSDFPLELGAQTISGSDSIFAKIFQDYSLPTAEFDPQASLFVMDSAAKSTADWAGDADLTAAQTFVSQLASQSGNTQSVADAATSVPTRSRNIVNSMVGNAYGADNISVGIGSIAEGLANRTVDNKILGLKTNPLQDILISRFNAVQSLVKLSTPITVIDYQGTKASLTAKDGTVYEADLVLVTVPVSILKAGGITFTPSLPGDFTGALSKIGMGPCMRVIIEFKKNFWSDTAPYIFGMENAPEYFSAGLGRSQFNATLCLTIQGSKAATLSSLLTASGQDAVINSLLADLDAVFANQATQYIRINPDPEKLNRIYVIDDWTNREYIKGGFSYPMPGGVLEDRTNISKPIDDKLYFAGEATDTTGQAGSLNGALASATRAAEEIITYVKSL